MAVQAVEMTDTLVIKQADQVTIMTSDTLQRVEVIGKEGDKNYRYENAVPLNEYMMKKRKKQQEKEEKWGWNGQFDLGVGVAIPTNAPDGYGFAPFKSWEIFFGPRYGYTPKNASQTYSFGLWVDWRTYGLSTDKMFAVQDGVVGLVDYPVKAESKYSRIRVFSLSVPLTFTQRFGKWSIDLGPVVNFNLYGRVYNRYELENDKMDMSTKGLEYRPVTIDLMAGFQHGGFGAYLKYSPMSVLKKDKGPQFHSLTLGLYL